MGRVWALVLLNKITFKAKKVEKLTVRLRLSLIVSQTKRPVSLLLTLYKYPIQEKGLLVGGLEERLFT
ncbi:MAG: hypothetical protein HRU05_15245 [Oceanospirillaceae bacterium]|nr:hypothetical protein [Oceanospirillaceae bacterium]